MDRQRRRTFLEAMQGLGLAESDEQRAERQAVDRLAAIKDVWLLFLDQLKQHFVPDANITVDEQLVGYRGRAPGRTYISHQNPENIVSKYS